MVPLVLEQAEPDLVLIAETVVCNILGRRQNMAIPCVAWVADPADVFIKASLSLHAFVLQIDF